MSRAPLDDDAQRALERRALGNVAWLAQRLGYRDALEARTEKIVVVVLGLLVAAVVAVLFAKAATQKSRDEARLDWNRCMVAYRAGHTDEARAQVRKANPDLRGMQLVSSTEDRLSLLVRRECGELPE